jgi:hypothetical protein
MEPEEVTVEMAILLRRKTNSWNWRAGSPFMGSMKTTGYCISAS